MVLEISQNIKCMFKTVGGCQPLALLSFKHVVYLVKIVGKTSFFGETPFIFWQNDLPTTINNISLSKTQQQHNDYATSSWPIGFWTHYWEVFYSAIYILYYTLHRTFIILLLYYTVLYYIVLSYILYGTIWNTTKILYYIKLYFCKTTKIKKLKIYFM